MEHTSIPAIETANLNGFPAEMQRADGSWLTLLSPGVPARRVNSLNVFDPRDDARIEARLDETRALFAHHDITFHLRHTPLTPPALTAHVDARGWLSAGETDVWTRPVDAAGALDATGIDGDHEALSENDGIGTCSLEDWLAAFIRVGGTRPETVAPGAVEQLGAALARVAARRVCLVARGGDAAPAAVAIAVADRDLLGIYDLAVAPAARRCGLGARMVDCCLEHGRRFGCRTAWLQVVRENVPARALYRQRGFRHAYGYHYRFPPPGG
ncbi:N-acetyltransferase [Stappia sp. ES.058]|uniref:GNAT family N-acetyltransferase n=1 Tax=Stappia sp. ES.058 TaxID=1881061 RepID=UPI00087CF3DF|nr:GNAT family N-acetyltransferase [Stappia sp. ES.058]SDU37799.1 Acetyltransferase (GNAT) family protein [Stappia sp. ES.058]